MTLSETQEYTSNVSRLSRDDLRDERTLAKARLDIAFGRFKDNPGADQWLKMEDAMRLHQGFQKNAFRNQSGEYSVTLYVPTEAA